ncbi:MAG: hypothetical protein ACRDZM_10790 [Acidimicrobiia bacterium]
MLAPDHVEAGQTRSNQSDGLGIIADLLEIERYRIGEWDETYARLYAIDCASIVYRYHIPDLNEMARDLVQRLLHQARQLVTSGRERELASIERALMTGLDAASSVTRSVWLVALNAVLPDPFRAAVMSTEAALLAFGRGPNPRRDAVAESVRRRLLSRTEEAALLGVAGPQQRLPYAVA